MAFTRVTITHDFNRPDLAGSVGTVDFTPVEPMTLAGESVSGTERAVLADGGVLSQEVAASTAPGTAPSTTVPYRIVVRLAGEQPRTYYKPVPHNQGDTIDLAVLLGWASAGSGSGGEGGGLGDTVVSVNGHAPNVAGDVALSASDVGAQPASTNLTALSGLGDGVPVRSAGVWSSLSPGSLGGGGAGSAGLRTQIVAYAATLSLDVSLADIFSVILTGDLTLTGATGAANCQPVYLDAYADGAARVVSLGVGGPTVTIPAGNYWFASFRYRTPGDLLVLVEEAIAGPSTPTPPPAVVAVVAVVDSARLNIDTVADGPGPSSPVVAVVDAARVDADLIAA